MQSIYESAKERYAALGVDTDAAIEKLLKLPISMHVWQGDDVRGFENAGSLTGGIQATGNYPGAARTPEELMTDLDKTFSLIPGKHKVNVHACYGIYPDGKVADRDALKPEHFAPWVEYAKKRGLGLDFNPTFFSHPLASDGTLTLASDVSATDNIYYDIEEDMRQYLSDMGSELYDFIYPYKSISLLFGPAKPGDLDEDGRITVDDITLLIAIYLGEGSSPAADVDGDGHVTVDDITNLIGIYLNDGK